MTVTNYVVPHRGFGEPRRLTVDTVNPEMFLKLLSLAEDSHLPVTLCGHSSSGFRVRMERTSSASFPPPNLPVMQSWTRSSVRD